MGGETYVVAGQLLLLVHLGVVLVNTRPERVGVAAESDVQALQELVAAGQQALGRLRTGVDRGLTVEDDDAVGEVGSHGEIVLDDECRLLGVHDETLNDTRGDDTLLGVKIPE